jgi:hypothetical protein
MNCKRIEEMIPLYVGGDLERKNSELVSSHLRSCPACSIVAGQYSESQEWLQSYRPAELGSAFFDDLKRGVFSQIELEESRPSFLQAIAARWKWNAVFAAAAFLVMVGGLAFYASRRGPDERPVHNQSGVVPRTDEPTAPPQERVATDPDRDPQKTKPRRRHMRAPIKETIALTVEAMRPEQVGDSPGVSREEAVESEAAPSLDENPQTEWDPVTMETTTRIEIQTGDPNIRIIWFIPKDFVQLSNRRATDT